jgi:hypothetical protein
MQKDRCCCGCHGGVVVGVGMGGGCGGGDEGLVARLSPCPPQKGCTPKWNNSEGHPSSRIFQGVGWGLCCGCFTAYLSLCLAQLAVLPPPLEDQNRGTESLAKNNHQGKVTRSFEG